MNAGLNPYVEIKQSGIRWLGKIPSHWELKRPKQLFRKMTRPVRDIDEVVTCFRDGVVTLRKNRRLLGFTESLKEIGYQGVRKGDLVIHGMDAFAGSIGVSDSDGKATPVYSVCAPMSTHVNSHYYAHCVREMARTGWITALARGIRERSSDFRFDVFGAQIVPFPPASEQTAIARFLDHMDGRIQKYIRAKEKLIAMLDEYKQALIHEAVTGQINVRTGEPYPEYKESGVEWFGDVPIEWELVALRHLGTKFGSGVTPRGGSAIYTDKGVAFLRSQNIHFDGLQLGSVARIPKEIHESLSGTHVKCDDVLLNITGASIGRVACVPKGFEDANVNQHVCIIRPKRNRILPEFLAAFLSTPVVQNEIQVEQSGASREGLTLDSIRSIKVALPSVVFQKQIVDAVQRIRKQITNVTDSTMEEVKLLNEYRTRLIADVVTGKLDVRKAATELRDTKPVAWKDGVDKIQAEAHSHRADNGIAVEANA